MVGIDQLKILVPQEIPTINEVIIFDIKLKRMSPLTKFSFLLFPLDIILILLLTYIPISIASSRFVSSSCSVLYCDKSIDQYNY